MKNSKVSILCILIVFIFLCAGFIQQEERKSTFVSLYKPSFVRVETSGMEEIVYINTSHIVSVKVIKPCWVDSKTNARITLSTGNDVDVKQDVFSILRQCNQEIQVEKSE